MDATTTVAVAGLASTAATAVLVPWIQGRVAAKAATAGRVHERKLAYKANIREQQLATYVAASAHVDAIQRQLDFLTTPPSARTGSAPAVSSHQDVTSRVRLFAPALLFEAWRELLNAHEVLWIVLNEQGENYIAPKRGNASGVRTAIDAVTRHLRGDIGIDDPFDTFGIVD